MQNQSMASLADKKADQAHTKLLEWQTKYTKEWLINIPTSKQSKPTVWWRLSPKHGGKLVVNAGYQSIHTVVLQLYFNSIIYLCNSLKVFTIIIYYNIKHQKSAGWHLRKYISAWPWPGRSLQQKLSFLTRPPQS